MNFALAEVFPKTVPILKICGIRTFWQKWNFNME